MIFFNFLFIAKFFSTPLLSNNLFAEGLKFAREGTAAVAEEVAVRVTFQ